MMLNTEQYAGHTILFEEIRGRTVFGKAFKPTVAPENLRVSAAAPTKDECLRRIKKKIDDHGR